MPSVQHPLADILMIPRVIAYADAEITRSLAAAYATGSEAALMEGVMAVVTRFNNLAVELSRTSGGALGKGKGAGSLTLQAEMLDLNLKLDPYDAQIARTFVVVDHRIQEMAQSEALIKRVIEAVVGEMRGNLGDYGEVALRLESVVEGLRELDLTTNMTRFARSWMS